MQAERRMSSDPQTTTTDFDCASAGKECYRLHPPSPFIKPTLISPSHGGCKVELTKAVGTRNVLARPSSTEKPLLLSPLTARTQLSFMAPPLINRFTLISYTNAT